MLACKRGHANTVNLLLLQGAEITKRNHQHESAVDIALHRNYSDIVSKLRQVEGTNRIRNQNDTVLFHHESVQAENRALTENCTSCAEIPRVDSNSAASITSVVEDSEVLYTIDRIPDTKPVVRSLL